MHPRRHCGFWHYIDCVLVSLITCFLLLLASFFSCIYFPFLFTFPLSYPLRIAPFSIQARCCRSRLNLGYNLSLFILCQVGRLTLTQLIRWVVICQLINCTQTYRVEFLDGLYICYPWLLKKVDWFMCSWPYKPCFSLCPWTLSVSAWRWLYAICFVPSLYLCIMKLIVTCILCSLFIGCN